MHSQLKQYLGEVEHGLKSLPAKQRQDELLELQAHLEAMAEANQELGSSEEEAYKAAIAQFGASQEVSHELETVQRAGWRKWGETALYALAASAIADLIARPLFAFLRLVIPSAYMPVSPKGATVFVYGTYFPLLLGLIALGYLVYKNGWRRIVNTVRRSDSTMAIATLWVIIFRLFATVHFTIAFSGAFLTTFQSVDKLSHITSFFASSLLMSVMDICTYTEIWIYLISGMLLGKIATPSTRLKTVFQGIGVAIVTMFVTMLLKTLVRFSDDIFYVLIHVLTHYGIYGPVALLAGAIGLFIVRKPKLATPRKVQSSL